MRRRLACFGLILIGGCTTSESELPTYDSQRYGMASCPSDLTERCSAIADKTFMSYGPVQVEYHSPDGRSYLWVGDKIVQGYWRVIPGMFRGRLCYEYGNSASNCDGDITKGDPGRTFRQGDPYKLAESRAAPFDLRSLSFRTNLDEVDRVFSTTSSTN